MRSKFFILTLMMMFCSLSFGQNNASTWGGDFNHHDYATNMQVVAKITVNGEVTNPETLQIAAFCDNERRSFVVNPTAVNDNYLVSLQIYGDKVHDNDNGGFVGDNRDIIIKVYDGQSEYVLYTLQYDANAVIGDLSNPNEMPNMVFNYVAKIGTTNYATLQAAIDAAQNNETVTMLADVTPSEQVVINKSIILDLNNKTITGTGATYRPLKVAGNNSDIAVTIKNGTVKTENVTTKPEQAACVLVYDGADVTFENVVMNGSNYGVLMAGYNDYATGVSNNNITSIVVNGENTNIKAVNAAIIAQGAYPNISIQINAGNVESTESIAIYQPTKGDLTINGGTITGSTAVYVKAGNLKVNGGTIIGNGEYAGYEYVESGATSTGDAIVIESCNYGYYGAPTALIEGGVINSTNAAPVASYQYENNEQVKNFISGGTFNKEIASDLIALGFKLEANTDGTYGVVVDPAYGKVAKIGGTYYETLQEALIAITSGCTLDILTDITITEKWDCRYTGAKITFPVTINGNDKTIKFTGEISDGYNHLAAFRFEAPVTVNNLVVDMSEAVAVFQNRFSAISTKANLTVNESKFIGSTTYANSRAIIFGEGGHEGLEIVVNETEFINWKYGVVDNMNGGDVKSVTITGNRFDNANVQISALESITFTGNTTDSDVQITSYTANNTLNVTAKNNNLAADGTYTVKAGGTLDLQDEFLTPVADVNGKIYFTLQDALNYAVTAADVVTVTLLDDINLEGKTWTPVYFNSYIAEGTNTLIIDGNNKTISNLTDMLFSGTWTGKRFEVKNLTIYKANIKHNVEDAGPDEGVGAVVGNISATEEIEFNNVKLVQSHVEGGHWTGGLIGYAAGYSGNDGPVFTNIVIKNNCEISGSTIVGKGSVGGVVGHATGDAWTSFGVEATTISGNTITSTGSSVNKAGIVMGTIGAAGTEQTTNNISLKGGVFVSVTESGNTATSNGTAITRIYGRQGSTTGILTLTEGGSYQNNPIEENVAYAVVAPGYKLEQDTNGTYGVVEDPAYGKVAKIGDTYYETVDAAFAAAQDGDNVEIFVAGTYALTTSGKDITITGAVDGVVFDNIGAKNMGGANVTFNNVTFDYYPNVNYTGLQHSGNLVYNNCTINGQVFLYGTSETFNNCTFNQNSADAYNVCTYGAEDVDFIECTFNSVGKSVLIYSEQSDLVNDVTVTDCDFIASAPVDGKAAIEMDSSLTAGINLTIDGETTAEGFGSGNVSDNSLWNNKKGNETEANNDITVVVNDETVLAPLTLVAAAGGTNYTSLQAAYNAVAADGTITILNDVTGAGVVIDKNVTIDFNGKTYTFNEGVGSGTLTSNGFQILQGNTVVLNNGKLEVAAEAADKFYILVQNYANLTIEDMNLDGTNLDKWSLTDGDSYVLSNNSGTVNITGATNITANNDGDKAFAFDVCKYGSYTAPTVNVNTTGTIAGKIEVSSEIPTNLNISGGTFTVEIEEAWCAEGFIPVKNADNTWTVKVGKFIAKTETGDKFETLQEAVNAGTTVTLLDHATGAGVVINKDVTIDFNGKTYTVNKAVGSAGTETLGFQILKNNNVTLKNGTLTSTTPVVAGKDVKMLIQNYANLTLIDMNLVDNTDHILYALSNNSGTSNIEGATNITTDKVAFDVYDYTAGGYAVPTVNVSTTGKITGAIEVSVTATLNISGGTFTNEIYEDWCAEFFSPYYNETDKTWTVVLTGGVQTIQLGNGWNWFSSYVDMSGENGLATLQDALGTSGRQIKSQVTNHFSSYSVENQEWYGNSEFTSLHKEKMYMIQTSTDVELELSGDFIDYEETPIQVNKGWNWISYPVNETVDINEALKNLNASDNDIVKMHGATFATYYKGEWLANNNNEVMTLEPGQGYMYYRKASDATSFVYNVPAENNNNKTNVAATDYRWTSASAEYANNMTITAMLSVDGELVRGDYEIAALVNGEVRGNARPVYIESLDAYMLFMTVFGDDVEEVTFRYYDVETGAEFDLDNNIIYSTDAIVGSIEEPYMFNLDILNIGETSIDEINVYPNPTTIGREISLDATCDTVEVFNALGVKVAEYHNVDSIDAIETAGIYVIRVTIDGNARNCRLVVK